jgi:anaerobic magnesium-protoporphyrin IX monomethyl ester cyclase
MYQPLGLLYLASAAREAGFTVTIIDLRDGPKPFPECRYVGFSCTTPEITDAKRIAKACSCPTIVGGPHPSLLTEDCLDDFDCIVVGEGEKAIIDILRNGITQKIVRTERIKDLDSLPLPAWGLLDNPFSDTLFPGEKYGKGAPAASLIASRGCPFNCSFCGNLYRTPVIYRSISSISDEIAMLVNMGVRHFRFEDDNLTIHPEFERLCEVLHSFDIRYKGHTRSDLLTKEHAELLRWSGCEEMGLGVESADDQVLMKNNKRESAGDHRRAVHILKQAGIRAKVYLMCGLPGETRQTIKLNKQFMREAKPDKWTLSRFTPYPGCAVWYNPSRFGVRILNWDWTQWWNFPDSSVHELEKAPIEELDRRYYELYEWLRREEWK